MSEAGDGVPWDFYRDKLLHSLLLAFEFDYAKTAAAFAATTGTEFSPERCRRRWVEIFAARETAPCVSPVEKMLSRCVEGRPIAEQLPDPGRHRRRLTSF